MAPISEPKLMRNAKNIQTRAPVFPKQPLFDLFCFKINQMNKNLSLSLCFFKYLYHPNTWTRLLFDCSSLNSPFYCNNKLTFKKIPKLKRFFFFIIICKGLTWLEPQWLWRRTHVTPLKADRFQDTHTQHRWLSTSLWRTINKFIVKSFYFIIN